jgi:serine/threonine protein kinase
MNPDTAAFAPAGFAAPVVPEHKLFCAIAAGAYGQVWLACNSLGVYRAVKIVHRASFDHDRPFEREFAGIKAFEPISRSHEGLVDLLQVGRDDAAGYFYYVMELADDLNANGPTQSVMGSSQSERNYYTPRTLASELKRRGRLPLEECIQIGLSLTEALAHLHRQGLVHRDVKPSNIIFVQGVPKLADVGLVTGVGEARSFVGTEGFIPPEGPGTPQADLYSLGIVLYVISTGKSHQDFPEPLSDLAADQDRAQWLEFDAIIHKASQAEARGRYRSAEEMHDELVLLQLGHSVKRKRAAHRRWTAIKRLGLCGIAAALLLMTMPLLKRLKHDHTPNPEAVRLYNLGRWYYNQLTPEAHKKALECLNQAIQIDPNYVKPYGELTALYLWSQPGVLPLCSDAYRLQQTRAIANKLLAIDPKLAEGHAALSYSKFLERDWRGAEDEIVRAIDLNPNLQIARDFYIAYLSLLVRPAEANRQAQLSQALDPSSRASTMVAAWPFMAERRFDLAIAQLQQVVKLDGNFPQAHNYLGRCYEAESNYVLAIEQFKTSDLLVGNDPAKVTASYAAIRDAYESQGQQGYFRKWIELIQADESLPEEKRLFDDVDLAGAYARLGEKQKALDEIERNFDRPGVWWQLKFEPLYDSLHDEPRFKALLKRAGFEK